MGAPPVGGDRRDIDCRVGQYALKHLRRGELGVDRRDTNLGKAEHEQRQFVCLTVAVGLGQSACKVGVGVARFL